MERQMPDSKYNNFDERASTWDDNPGRRELAKNIAAAVRKNIPLSKKMTACEYGCGTGLLSFNLHSSLGNIRMFDTSDGMLDVLAKKIRENKIKNMFPEKLDLTTSEHPDKTYDLICTQMTLHHIIDVNKVLNSFYRMLKTPGYLFVADLDEEDGSFHGKDFDGHNGFNRDAMKKLLEGIGFSVAGCETAFEITKPDANGNNRTYPVFAMTARKM